MHEMLCTREEILTKNSFILFIGTILLSLILHHHGQAAQKQTESLIMASSASKATKKPHKSRYKRVLEIYADDKSQGSGRALFSISTPEINVALNLGKATPHTFVFVVVTDKNWDETIFQIPVVVDTKSGVTVTTLKRPMSGWIKGEYEVVVKDTKESIISTAFFSINDE